MSSDAVTSVPKVKKPRKSKTADAVAAVADVVAPDTEVKLVDLDLSGAAKVTKTKAPRHPRFDPNLPSSYFNLQDVWAYRVSQRRNLQKMKSRVENAKDENERAKLSLNVLRNEKNLLQLEENLNDVHRQVNVVAELLRAGVKSSNDSVSTSVVDKLVAGLVEAARSNAASPHNNASEK